ncbi:uncharacterized protein LOC110431726 [Sorghum bicolor]|uniref:uncharacterized protein LOC110431726 n=1 Tax=Sorghum bicolor TaxID=4558 RepID=UPI000B4237B2|nr:uncharacterized protein LOC110431726 [Sorghum bicolor]|eukprot:XP_021306847.1 uncharacterized protein LOC110431726 [Sorghum bicolor]
MLPAVPSLLRVASLLGVEPSATSSSPSTTAPSASVYNKLGPASTRGLLRRAPPQPTPTTMCPDPATPSSNNVDRDLDGAPRRAPCFRPRAPSSASILPHRPGAAAPRRASSASLPRPSSTPRPRPFLCVKHRHHAGVSCGAVLTAPRPRPATSSPLPGTATSSPLAEPRPNPGDRGPILAFEHSTASRGPPQRRP